MREGGEGSSREGERKGRRRKEVNSDGWKGSIMKRDREIWSEAEREGERAGDVE